MHHIHLLIFVNFIFDRLLLVRFIIIIGHILWKLINWWKVGWKVESFYFLLDTFYFFKEYI